MLWQELLKVIDVNGHYSKVVAGRCEVPHESTL